MNGKRIATGRITLSQPTIALEIVANDSRMQFVSVPAGAHIQFEGDPNSSGLVGVLFGGQRILMFLEDIQSRGQHVRAQGQ
jgi:hypothetical protein